eukprot:m.208582 g.208582  ORF g.208582 m.208582 type:complete len:486 (-) comp13767_c0_seq2:355-1812(-)
MGPPQSSKGMEKYIRVKLLGKGTFGKAWKVRDSSSGTEYVAKQIKCENKQDLEDALAEANVLSKVQHINIVSYQQVIRNSPKLVTIIMEYCAGGDVGEKIARRKFRNQYFDEGTIQLWMVQSCAALEYLHNKGILHRDVKPANLFLSAEAIVKLGDFGIARVLDRNAALPSQRTSKTPVGTPMYFSPEMCSGKRYGQKADMWALGCVLYELASLRPAFTAYNMDSLTAKIKRGHHDKYLPPRYGPSLRKLITSLLALNPSHRPSATEMLHNDYLTRAVEKNEEFVRSMSADVPDAKGMMPHAPKDVGDANDHTPNVLSIDEHDVDDEVANIVDKLKGKEKFEHDVKEHNQQQRKSPASRLRRKSHYDIAHHNNNSNNNKGRNHNSPSPREQQKVPSTSYARLLEKRKQRMGLHSGHQLHPQQGQQQQQQQQHLHPQQQQQQQQHPSSGDHRSRHRHQNVSPQSRYNFNSHISPSGSRYNLPPNRR